jgi:type IV secretion system protein VirD4
MIRAASLSTLFLILAFGALTQWVAARAGYHPVLGPSLGGFYPPWEVMVWQMQPWSDHMPATFDIARVAALAIAAAAFLPAVVVKSRLAHAERLRSDVHGTAKFASWREIKGMGLLRGKGVYLGAAEHKGKTHYLRHDGPEHVAVIAPTRAGKGVSNIIPTMLSWRESCVIYDRKAELWHASSGWRSRFGKVMRWQPGKPADTARYNFLAEVRLDQAQEVADVQNIALMLIDPRGEGLKDHWMKTSYQLLSGVILFALLTKRDACMGDVARLISDPQRTPERLYMDMSRSSHPFVAQMGSAQLRRPDEERGNIHSTVCVALDIFSDPVIAANTAVSDFSVSDLVNCADPVSLYIVTPGDDEDRLRPLVRLLLTTIMRRLTGVELTYRFGRPLMPHRHRLLMMLDEFPSLSRMEFIESALATCAGYGIKAMVIMQDRIQLLGKYGQYESVISNCTVRVVFAPNQPATAQWISDMAGTSTVVTEDVSESGNGLMARQTKSIHRVARPLVTAGEVMALKPPVKDNDEKIVEAGTILIFNGGSPIKGKQILSFKNSTFSERQQISAPGVAVP